jgi:hypothetical protein
MVTPEESSMHVYEVRLICSQPNRAIILGTTATNDDDATEYARRALERHPDCDRAEVWRGMTMVRQV